MSEKPEKHTEKRPSAKGRPLILLADIDGTLVGKDMQVSREDLSAIQDFMARGHFFSFATGRGRTNAEFHMKDLATNFPAVFANGALLYDRSRDRVILEHTMSTLGLRDLFRSMQDYYPDVMIQIYTRDETFLITDNDPADYRVANHQPYRKVRFEEIEGIPCDKFFFGMQPENCEGGRAVAEERLFGNRDLRVVKSQKMFLEVTSAGVSKGRMVEYIRQNTDALVAVAGDYYNDIEMMEAGEVSYTLHSSPREVREAADRILDSRPGEFISLVIRDLLNEDGSGAGLLRNGKDRSLF